MADEKQNRKLHQILLALLHIHHHGYTLLDQSTGARAALGPPRPRCTQPCTYATRHSGWHGGQANLAARSNEGEGK